MALAFCFLMNFGTFLRRSFHSCCIDSSSNPKEFYLHHFFHFLLIFLKKLGVKFYEVAY